MHRSLTLFALALFMLCACSGDEPPAEEPAAEEPAAEEPAAEEPAAEEPAAEDKAQEGESDGEAAEGASEGEAGGPVDLTDPSQATKQAPETYTAKLTTTKGDILIDVTRSWAPLGADRFYNLVSMGYYNDVAFFRVISGFMAQLGIHGEPAVARAWKSARISDDPVSQSNTPGMVTFATAGPNTRTTQIFMNFGNNANLDGMGFAPFGKVRSMDVLNQIHSGYGEGAPRGRGPHQGRLQSEGNAYLKAEFPDLDYIIEATILE